MRAPHLSEFPERPDQQELWLISRRALSRVNLETRATESIGLEFKPAHINYLPTHDWIVLDKPSADGALSVGSLVVFDPGTRQVVRRIPLPAN